MASMKSKQHKRSHPSVEDRRADCPFQIALVSCSESQQQQGAGAKKRRKASLSDTKETKKPFFQPSPFKPAGKFRARGSLDVYYHIEPRKKWTGLTRYNSFVINGCKYLQDAYVFVTNDQVLERHTSAVQSPTDQINPAKFWIARILEIRASDEHHVYARILWMYSPDDLPAANIGTKKIPAGRLSHHGLHELVASNHMDIINVVSIVQLANVCQWIESDDEIQEAMYWRQAFDCLTTQLSSIDLICSCQTPANPDETLIGCTNFACGEWMHMECLRRDVLKRIYDRLGDNLPYVHAPPDIKEERQPVPLSPPDLENEQPQPTFTFHGATSASQSLDEISAKKGQTPLEEEEEDEEEEEEEKKMTPPSKRRKSMQIMNKRKNGRGRNSDAEPYLKLFEAELRMNDGPTMWEITDLRLGVMGGQKTWKESPSCLLCNFDIE